MRLTLIHESILCVLAASAACGDGRDSPVDAVATADVAVDVPTPACDLTTLEPIPTVATTRVTILPSATARGSEVIDDMLQGTIKRHVVVGPTDPAQRNGKLFVWMSGSGAEPYQYEVFLATAATAGYIAVSLAYDNETSVGDTCGIANDPQCGPSNVDCEEDVREEMVYGSGVHDSPCVDIAPSNSIEHRILRLVQHLATTAPGSGAGDVLLPGNTALDWSKIGVGGWSQGGGHASMLSRDHLVARAIYSSKGAGSVFCSQVKPSSADCDLDGDGMLTPGNADEYLVPVPWASQPRQTPGARQFAAIHREEDAWNYSRETFALFGMGDKGSEVELDAVGGNFAAYGCGHTFGLGATPACGATDFHKSMALDGCLARDPGGIPILAAFWYYALKLPVP